MPTYRLAVPFIILFLLGIYLTYEVSSSWSFLIIIGMVALVAGFILAPQINWWWWERFPPDIPPELQKLLTDRHPFYRNLSATEQREFRRRVFLFNQGNNFMPQGMEDVPPDAQLMIAVAPVTLTFREPVFLFDNFENIVLYPHDFPSPQFPEQFHASEIYEPDGVVMFCFKHVASGFLQPGQYLNPAWYEYARIFRINYPGYDYGDWSGVSWTDLEAISQFPHAALQRWIGLPELDLTAMGIAHYFLFPTNFQRQLPEIYHRLQSVFSIKNN
ncbi:MAG: hypothetical protein DA408_08705 [Bacteroidetes bacterium]|nr:MAG: hypothetical protein C7N36_00260 [Bacteroidota bacterium]PTM12926.1 MAG: hypothetical protein DA408_08705 [Bacteroidota bacterium]